MKLIATALVKAQKSFDEAVKSSKNPFFKSSYADLSECIDAVIPHLHANGIAVMQPTHECDTGVLVETLLIHESGETLSSGKLYLPAGKNDPQAYMAALTYARRGSLSAALSIKTADDDGNTASKLHKASTSKPAPAKTPPTYINEDLMACKTIAELKKVFSALTKEEQANYFSCKEEMKVRIVKSTMEEPF